MLVCMGINLAFTEMGTEYPWVLKRDMEGIKVYNRKVEGSPILEFRSEMIVTAPLDKTLAFFEQDNNMSQWFHRCKESKLVEEISPDEKRIYFAADLILPFDDRDGVYRRIKTEDPVTQTVTYTVTADNRDYPRHKHRVRIEKLTAEWRFTPIENDRTLVEYRQHSEAGGFIPPVLANLFVVTLPFKTFRKFRAALTATVPGNQ